MKEKEKENNYFERDYTLPEEERQKTDEFFQCIVENGTLKAYGDVMKETPKYIVRKDKRNFEYLRERCDWFARENRGKIAAKVDYKEYIAWIDVYLPFFEFAWKNTKKFLIEVLKKSDTVTFEINNGMLRMHILILYFADIVDKKTIDKGWEELFKTLSNEELKKYFGIELDDKKTRGDKQDKK